MRLFKKVAALLLAVTLAVPTMAVSASDISSPEKKPIVGTTAKAVYNGQARTDLVKFEDEEGNVLANGEDYTITNISWTGNDGTQTVSDGDVSIDEVMNAGKYTVKAEGKGNYKGEAETVITIAKATPVITASQSSFSYQMYKVYNRTLTARVRATSTSGEPVTYRLTKYGRNRGFSINGSTGNVTHPANSAYKVGDANVYCSVAENLNYKAASKKIATITIVKSFPHIKFDNQFKVYKKSAVDSKTRSYKLGAVGDPGTKLTYKVVTGAKYISVNKYGKVTVKKGTPKGKYKITVSNTNTAQYLAGPKNAYVTVK